MNNPDLVHDWLIKADQDVKLGEQVMPTCLQGPTTLPGFLFHCQQATEKLLKGLLAGCEISFRHTHDLGLLFKKLGEGSLLTPPERTLELAALTPFAVEKRYDLMDMATAPDMERTLALIRDLRQWTVDEVRKAQAA